MKTKKLLIGMTIAFGMLALTVKAVSGRYTPADSSVRHAHIGESFEEVEAYIQQQIDSLRVPGAAVAVIEGDEIVYQHGFGVARPGGEAPTPQTPFFIGSLTKSFTALAVMQLVEAGKVELDAPVQRYLPWFRVKDAQASAQMTVRHLLNQTSGLPTLAGEIVLTDFDDRPDANERQVRALAEVEISSPVGSTVAYSNLNYNVLGLIVEAASGETYSDYIQKHIFDPLEMRHSYTSATEAKQNNLAMGYRLWFSFPFPAPNLPIPQGSLPSGQLISCAEDMAHYLIAHMNGGHYGDTQILSAAGIDELHRGEKEYIAMGISSGKYAMGWFDVDVEGTQTYSHSGNVPDFSAFMAIIPDFNRGVILLLNADPFGMPPVTEAIGTNLTAQLAGYHPAPPNFGLMQWIMRLLPLIPLLQVAGAAGTLRRLGRWRETPALRPIRGRLWGEHILLPLVPNLSLAALLAYLLSTGLLRFMHLFMPDLAWILQINGGFAGIWLLLRSGLILRTLRKPLEETAA